MKQTVRISAYNHICLFPHVSTCDIPAKPVIMQFSQSQLESCHRQLCQIRERGEIQSKTQRLMVSHEQKIFSRVGIHDIEKYDVIGICVWDGLLDFFFSFDWRHGLYTLCKHLISSKVVSMLYLHRLFTYFSIYLLWLPSIIFGNIKRYVKCTQLWRIPWLQQVQHHTETRACRSLC